MLRLACSTARRSCVRSYATNPTKTNDELDRLLNLDGDHKTSLAEPKQLDDVPIRPPRAPVGSLPPGGNPLPSSKHALPTGRTDNIYHLHVSASRNNTILTFTDDVGNPRFWVSSGSCGFKHVQRSGYEAGYQCAVKMFKNIESQEKQNPTPIKIEIFFKGFGAGREALYRALMTTEGEVVRGLVARITDTTPVKIGGTRAKKARRL